MHPAGQTVSLTYPVVLGNVVAINTCGSWGSVAAGVTMLRVAAIWAVCGVGLEESVTSAVKLASPAAEGVPDIRPVFGLKLRPDGKVPERRPQAYGGVPPEQVRVA